jgi:hypothetical protein
VRGLDLRPAILVDIYIHEPDGCPACQRDGLNGTQDFLAARPSQAGRFFVGSVVASIRLPPRLPCTAICEAGC